MAQFAVLAPAAECCAAACFARVAAAIWLADPFCSSTLYLCNSVTCCTLYYLLSILHSSQELSPQIEAFDALPCCSGGHNCEVKLIGHAWQSRTIQRIHRGPIIKGRSITLSWSPPAQWSCPRPCPCRACWPRRRGWPGDPPAGPGCPHHCNTERRTSLELRTNHRL